MAHILVLGAKARRNERSWHTPYIGNMFGPTFGFKIHSNFYLRNEIYWKIVVLLIYIFMHGKKSTLPCTSPDLAQKPSSDRL